MFYSNYQKQAFPFIVKVQHMRRNDLALFVTGDRSNQLSYTPRPFGTELVLPVNLLSPNQFHSLTNIDVL
tara:strand:- start:39 stop:248 length:210 start_codon:yes stop_codon:yes gene_type:complete